MSHATFFYSIRQAIRMEESRAIQELCSVRKYIDHKEYTELKSSAGVHGSTFEDAYVVAEFDNLPECSLLKDGSADTSSLDITIIKD